MWNKKTKGIKVILYHHWIFAVLILENFDIFTWQTALIIDSSSTYSLNEALIAVSVAAYDRLVFIWTTFMQPNLITVDMRQPICIINMIADLQQVSIRPPATIMLTYTVIWMPFFNMHYITVIENNQSVRFILIGFPYHSLLKWHHMTSEITVNTMVFATFFRIKTKICITDQWIPVTKGQ